MRPRAPAPGRLASHRRIDRGPGIALPFRLLLGVAVVALGIGILLIANGGIGKVASAVGSAFGGLVSDLTKAPAPSVADLGAADPPTLEAPDEPYTNQPTVDLVGTVPAAVVGVADSRIRVYVAIGKGDPGVMKEVPVPTSGRQFQVPGVALSNGVNVFTATIVGADGRESDASAAVTFILDKTKPKITISAPQANSTVNARTVQVVGTTQPRSAIRLHDGATNATVVGAADDKGAFAVTITLGTGPNPIELDVTDPAGNMASTSITVRRGTGALTANVTASFSQLKLSKLPEPVRLSVAVNDPDGQPLAGATVTFTLAVPGVPAIVSSPLTTSGNGRASFTTTIPKGASTGQCSITVIVHTSAFGDTTDRALIVLSK